MNRIPGRALIGAFVIGAIFLIAALIIIFGSGRYLSRQPVYVMYFQGSVKGLSEGSPVMLRGVRIGSVKDISIRLSPDAASVMIPVLVHLDAARFSEGMSRTSQQKYIKDLIDNGLKAQLQLQNILTSQLFIALDFYPDKPARLMGTHNRYVEIPTIPSNIELITKTIERLPLEELANKLTSTLEGIERTIRSAEVEETMRLLNLAIRDFRTLAQEAGNRVDPLASEITSTLAQTRQVLQHADIRLSSALESLEQTSDTARITMSGADKAFGAIRDTTRGDSSLVYQLGATLDEVSAAARSIRTLAEYLERHPEALVRGKGRE